jgi:hypothetical protein
MSNIYTFWLLIEMVMPELKVVIFIQTSFCVSWYNPDCHLNVCTMCSFYRFHRSMLKQTSINHICTNVFGPNTKLLQRDISENSMLNCHFAYQFYYNMYVLIVFTHM